MRAFLLTLSVLALGACGNDGRLMNLSSSDDGPEEFAIVPTRPLELPPDLAQLPAPTPGGANITDPNPAGDAIAALGGNPGHLAQQGIGAGDGALVTYAGRAGVTPGVRQVVAAEDQAVRARRGRRPLEVLGRVNVYGRAYEPQTLDSWAEQDRWRRAGAQVPAAPPTASDR